MIMTRKPGSPEIRAVVCDVDGTLLRRDGTIGPADRRAVARLTRAGTPVVLATGRIPAETLPYYHELGLATPVVCYHGALVLAPPAREPVGGESSATEPMAATPLPPQVAGRLVELILAEQPDARILLGLERRYVINRMGDLARHWDTSGPSCPTVGPLDEALARRVYKVCYYSPDLDRVPRIMRRVASELSASAAAQQAHAHLAEFLAPGVSKVRGLETVLRALGLDWDEVLAIGDYHNDAEMLRRARVGVAMAEAPEPVRAAADFVTADRDAGGVAEALDRFAQHKQ